MSNPATSRTEILTPAPGLDVDAVVLSQRFLGPLLIASRRTGRSPLGILVDWLGCLVGAPRLQADEFFKYGLFDPARHPPAARGAFVGVVRRTLLNRAANAAAWSAGMVNNKLHLEATLRGFGVRTTETLAVLGDPARFSHVTAFRVLTGPDELRAFLAAQSAPVFGKPLTSSLSLGTVGIDRLGADGETLHLSNGTTMPLATLWDQVQQHYFDGGYALQRKLTVHPGLVRYPGTAVGSFRVVTLATPDGVRPLYALWKIPSPASMADNFMRDPLLAAIDLASGRIVRCQKGTGVEAAEIDTLPGTDVRVVGETVPRWGELVDLAVHVARLFPDLRILGFDIALTPEGPTLIEANVNPDHGLYQLAAGRGFLQPQWAAWMRQAAADAQADLARRRRAERARDAVQVRRTRARALSDLGADLRHPRADA